MNFKSLIVVGLGIATLGLSLPAQADTGTVVTTDQTAIITGNGNVTVQSDNTSITNRSRGNRRVSNTGTVVTKSQTADVAGDDNLTVQDSTTTIRNDSTTVNRHRYRY